MEKWAMMLMLKVVDFLWLPVSASDFLLLNSAQILQRLNMQRKAGLCHSEITEKPPQTHKHSAFYPALQTPWIKPLSCCYSTWLCLVCELWKWQPEGFSCRKYLVADINICACKKRGHSWLRTTEWAIASEKENVHLRWEKGGASMLSFGCQWLNNWLL